MNWIKQVIFYLKKCVNAIINGLIEIYREMMSVVYDVKNDNLVQQIEKKENNPVDEQKMDKLLSMKVEDLTNEDVDYILSNVENGNIQVSDNTIRPNDIQETSRKSMKNTKTSGNKKRITINGVIRFEEEVPKTFDSITQTIMDTEGLINLININDGVKEGIGMQLCHDKMDEPLIITPNHVAAMDNITTWYKFNENLCINVDIRKRKNTEVLSNLMKTSEINSETKLFMGMKNSENGLYGVTTKVNRVYRMHVNGKLETVVISFIIPKADIRGPISGCPVMCGSTLYIANAARETNDLCEIYAVTILMDAKQIVYRNATTLRSREMPPGIDKLDEKLLHSSNVSFKCIMNLSSYPHNLLINHIVTKTKYKLSENPKLVPVVQNLMLTNDYLVGNLFRTTTTLLVVDYDDKYKMEKIKRIMQIHKSFYRVVVIDLSGYDLTEFKEMTMNQYSAISHHVPSSMVKAQNFTSVNDIPNESYVTVYLDVNGLATYTGLVRALKDKKCHIMLKYKNIGERLDIDWTIAFPIKCSRSIVVDNLVNNEPNWRYKAYYLHFVETPFGPMKLTKARHMKTNNKQQMNISASLKKKQNKKPTTIPFVAIAQLTFRLITKIFKYLWKFSKYVSTKLIKRLSK